MTDVLNSYLLQHKSINIPGVGSIYIQNKAAITDFVNKQLFPTSYSYRYDKYNETPDPGFYRYIAEKNGMTEEQANDWYQQIATDIRNRIHGFGYFEWEGVGVFKKDMNGDIIFEEQHKLLPFLLPVPAKRVIRKDSRHAILVGDKERTNVQMSEELLQEGEINQEPAPRRSSWWILALVLFVIALGILAFHFYQNGFRWGVTGNQQKIEVGK